MEPRKRKLVANKLAELCKSTERVLRCCLRIDGLSHNCPTRGSKGAIPGWGLQCWGNSKLLSGWRKTYKPKHTVGNPSACRGLPALPARDVVFGRALYSVSAVPCGSPLACRHCRSV